MTFDEGNLPELFKTRSRRGQRLTWTLSSNSGFLQRNEGWHQRRLSLVSESQNERYSIYFNIWNSAHHHKRISNPEWKPAHRAVWNHTGLAVDGNHVGSGVTHRTPTTPEKLLFLLLLISFVKDSLFKSEVSPDASVCLYSLKATKSSSLSPSKQCWTGRILDQDDQLYILVMDRQWSCGEGQKEKGTDICRHLHTSASGRQNDFQKAQSSRMFGMKVFHKL